MRVKAILITALAVGAIGAGLVFSMRPGISGATVRGSCPQSTPLFGLMPLLFRIGVLPKPPVAASVAPSDSSTSVVIHPDRNDQIQCGKASIKILENVVYAAPKRADGTSTPLKMDLFIPASVHKRTVVVYVPGGGFVMAAKESALNLRRYVAESGFVVASVQYRTIREGANYRDGVDDIKTAIRFLRENAGKYGIDADVIVIWGESAGGYLAAMVGVTNQSTVQGVIVDFGASDISKIAADFDAATQHEIYTNKGLVQYIGKATDSDRIDPVIAGGDANPLKYIDSKTPPFLILHGNRDRMVSPSQTLILHDALLAHGVHSTRYIVDGAGHGDLTFIGDTQSGLLWSTNAVMNLIVGFLNSLDAGT